jgi:aminomethyltransferase
METARGARPTPFTAYHRALGAKLVAFAGFEMPLRYTSEVREHLRVREAVGLFDITHMGEFVARGDGAGEFLQRAVTNDVLALQVGQAAYTAMCRPDGGIVDDLLVYRLPDRWMLVVNAATRTKDLAWLQDLVPSGVTIEDVSDETALLAVQGPLAEAVLRGQVPEAVLQLGFYRLVESRAFEVPAVISRTGYTGEDGFEIYFHPRHAGRVWEGLMSAGKPHGIEAVGLAARDTLRLEMGYMLYGTDIDETTTPLEAGIGWTVKLKKGDFVGREALLRQKKEGIARRLVGFELEGRRVPRNRMPIESDGRPSGHVTSGTFSPSLERPIGMGYVERAPDQPGGTFEVLAGGARLKARIVPRPFWTRGSRRSG